MYRRYSRRSASGDHNMRGRWNDEGWRFLLPVFEISIPLFVRTIAFLYASWYNADIRTICLNLYVFTTPKTSQTHQIKRTKKRRKAKPCLGSFYFAAFNKRKFGLFAAKRGVFLCGKHTSATFFSHPHTWSNEKGGGVPCWNGR